VRDRIDEEEEDKYDEMNNSSDGLGAKYRALSEMGGRN
jgi:hypothetical protein